MSKSYLPPEWSSQPLYPYSLEVIKEGTVIGTIDLSPKAYFIAGRQPDVCDIELEHPSISRQHAVFQHSSSGMKLLDWNSAQGTFVNKNKIEPGVYIDLHVGDVIKFAMSTRLYVVCGPEDLKPPEYESENLRKLREKLEARHEAEMKTAGQGISWGIREDEPVEDAYSEDEEEQKQKLPDYVKFDEHYDRKYGAKFESRLDLKDLAEYSEREKGIVEKIRKKERKIQNMQEENRRIFLKEGAQDGGLTEGQMAAVSRNDNRIQALQDEISALENELLSNSSARSNSSTDAKKKSLSMEEDEDEMYDTTHQTVEVSTNWRLKKRRAAASSSRQPAMPSKALSYEELMRLHEQESSRVVELIAQRGAVVESMTAFEARHQQDLVSPSLDEVEDVLVAARYEEHRTSLPLLSEAISAAQAKVARYEKLMKVAAPALESLAPQLKMNAEAVVKAAAAFSADNPLDDKVGASHDASPAVENLLKKRGSNLERGVAKFLESVSRNTNASQDELKSEQSSLVDVEKDLEHEVPPRGAKKPRVIGPAALPQLNASRPSAKTLEGGEAVWVPPSSQTGDGRTALNEKLGY